MHNIIFNSNYHHHHHLSVTLPKYWHFQLPRKKFTFLHSPSTPHHTTAAHDCQCLRLSFDCWQHVSHKYLHPQCHHIMLHMTWLSISIIYCYCCDDHMAYILSLLVREFTCWNSYQPKDSQLQQVCKAVITSSLVYAIPAWGGFLLDDLNNLFDGFLCHLHTHRQMSVLTGIEQLMSSVNKTTFLKALSVNHCLHDLLPQCKSVSMELTLSYSNCQLPICKYELYQNFFTVRSLFKFA